MRLPISETSRAVLIGTSTYSADSGFESLPTVAANLAEFETLLRTRTGLRHVTVALNPSGSVVFGEVLETAVDEAEDVLLFYFSGHGVTAGGDLALTHTASRSSMPGLTTVRYSDIREGIRASRAKIKIVILDCCHSGKAFGTGTLAGDQDEALKDLAVIDGTYVLTATDTKTKFAAASGPDGCTAFTGTLLRVLRAGAASSDEYMSMATVFPLLRTRLRAAGFPDPKASGRDTASEIALVRNARRIPATSGSSTTSGNRATSPTTDRLDATVQVNRGIALAQQGRSHDAVTVYQQVIDSYGDDPALREQVAQALYNWGIELGVQGRSEEKSAVHSQLIDRYGDDPALALRVQVAKALAEQGAYQQVIDRYGDDPALALRIEVATALVDWGNLRAYRSEKFVPAALVDYQKVIDRYGDDPDPALREQVAKAMVNRASDLLNPRIASITPPADRQRNRKEALATYQQVIDRYGNGGTTAALREQVRRAVEGLRNA
jgi:tetratricopeptide (TPR) repeat protein